LSPGKSLFCPDPGLTEVGVVARLEFLSAGLLLELLEAELPWEEVS
jgi:hypothetical protein